jgi:serine O-acetyltransferase
MADSTGISPTDPDWSRERMDWGYFNPGKYMLGAIRRYQRWKGRWGPIGKLVCVLSVIQNRIWGQLTGCDLPIGGEIGGGLLLPHPQGIIVHGNAKIGPNCLIFHQVTIGEGGRRPGAPRIGGHVDIGCGAKVLGGITIGNHAKIGANAVVLIDVPEGHTAVGIPARVIPPKA